MMKWLAVAALGTAVVAWLVFRKKPATTAAVPFTKPIDRPMGGPAMTIKPTSSSKIDWSIADDLPVDAKCGPGMRQVFGKGVMKCVEQTGAARRTGDFSGGFRTGDFGA